MKGTWIQYTPRQLEFVKRNRKLPRRELYAAFIRAFPRSKVSFDNLKSLCWRKGWKNGRDGRFSKGIVPANKGKKMPFNANSARTRFKKGNRSGRALEVYKPIGSTRLSKEGYVERKIHDGLPLQSRWRAVHLLNWEKKRGRIPKGHCLKCRDGNKANMKLSNWELITRAALARRNKRFSGVPIPAALEPAVIAIAKLEDRLHARSKGR